MDIESVAHGLRKTKVSLDRLKSCPDILGAVSVDVSTLNSQAIGTMLISYVAMAKG